MKKTFLTCMAVVALFAIASGAGAITCTIDQRPAATLLIPYFQTTFAADGSRITAGAAALDTLVTVGNASSAPMLAHISIWSERSELVLDFNIALTGFDIQSWSMGDLLNGHLPSTPVSTAHVEPTLQTSNVCQAVSTKVYPAAGGFLRVIPNAPASTFDNLATTVYSNPAFGLATKLQIIDSLDATADSHLCGGTNVENGTTVVITNPIHGYITIDHANYCTLTNPDDSAYWTQDAGGMENNLWGDYIFTNGVGLGTGGYPAVAIEADQTFRLATSLTVATATSSLADGTSAPTTLAGVPGRRTFYRRYLHPGDPVLCTQTDWLTATRATWDCGFGDQREPLGLKYAARWFDASPNVTSNFNVWRGSAVPDSVSGGLQDLLGFPFGKCNTSEPTVNLAFFDEDENTITIGCQFSPCGSAPTFNFPLETQRTSIVGFAHPVAFAGWVSMEFFNSSGPVGGALDQAYVTYDFAGATAFLSAGIPAAQLDLSSCQPIQVPCLVAAGCYGPTSATGVTVSLPVIPPVVGSGPAQQNP